MAKILITTQTQENYGAHDWDGTGECPQYWKFKGGMDYVIKKFKGSHADATMAVMALRSQIECDNVGFRENIIDFRIVKDNYLTEFEKSQLEYEGKVTYGPKELVW